MSSVSRPRAFLAAAAALVAAPAASALLATHNGPSHQPFGGRPSFLKLEASHQPFSELDNLRAKRLSIRRPLPEPEAEAVVEGHDAADAAPHHSLAAGLEYLYEAGQERHSDDLFHIILMPSTFHKDHMSLDHAAESCAEVLGIPSDKAQDLSLFAKHQGFSCLGTWTREECLSMGEELVSRDLDCRVIPFNGGAVPEDLPQINVAAAAGTVQEPVMDTYLLSYSS